MLSPPVTMQVYISYRSSTQLILVLVTDNGDELLIDIGGPGNKQELELCKLFGTKHDAVVRAGMTVPQHTIHELA